MKKFDVVVIGTGMGGATTGYALAKAGMRVLFLEKGKSRLLNYNLIQGVFAEERFKGSISKKDVLRLAGRASSTIKEKGRITNSFIPFIGETGGGSSALYGAILERFKPEDFLNIKQYDKNQSTKVEWPVQYQEMESFYNAAEILYRVKSESGEMHRELSEVNKKIWKQLEKNGLHPYFLPTATDNYENCIYDNCQSMLCRYGCKNDSEKICLQPAVNEFGALLLDDCEVLKLEEKGNRVSEIICRHNGKIITITSTIVILAAGALASPYILLKSRNAKWKNGLANRSGILGHYLMRHYIDLFAVDLKESMPEFESLKQIGFNDYYQIQGEKFGTVQSFGKMPPYEVVMEELSNGMPLSGAIKGLLKLIQPIAQKLYKKQFENKLVFASIMEDSPHFNNHIWEKQGNLYFRYEIQFTDKQKIKKFRKLVSKSFQPFKVDVIKQASNNKRIAHVCGTCRFGDDPALSVLNRFNRAHDVENLYVTDAAFFPTSGGINPSLTIAANALRVSKHIQDNI